jgi:hypothetical protein
LLFTLLPHRPGKNKAGRLSAPGWELSPPSGYFCFHSLMISPNSFL